MPYVNIKITKEGATKAQKEHRRSNTFTCRCVR